MGSHEARWQDGLTACWDAELSIEQCSSGPKNCDCRGTEERTPTPKVSQERKPMICWHLRGRCWSMHLNSRGGCDKRAGGGCPSNCPWSDLARGPPADPDPGPSHSAHVRGGLRDANFLQFTHSRPIGARKAPKRPAKPEPRSFKSHSTHSIPPTPLLCFSIHVTSSPRARRPLSIQRDPLALPRRLSAALQPRGMPPLLSTLRLPGHHTVMKSALAVAK